MAPPSIASCITQARGAISASRGTRIVPLARTRFKQTTRSSTFAPSALRETISACAVAVTLPSPKNLLCMMRMRMRRRRNGKKKKRKSLCRRKPGHHHRPRRPHPSPHHRQQMRGSMVRPSIAPDITRQRSARNASQGTRHAPLARKLPRQTMRSSHSVQGVPRRTTVACAAALLPPMPHRTMLHLRQHLRQHVHHSSMVHPSIAPTITGQRSATNASQETHHVPLARQ